MRIKASVAICNMAKFQNAWTVYLAELEMLNGEIHGLYNFRQTNFKGFSGTFYGQVTVSKD